MSTESQRRAELAKIHIGAKDLRLDRETYRHMLWTVARVKSAKDLDTDGRQKVIEHLKSRGWRPTTRQRTKPASLRSSQIDKIRALLRDADRPDEYADGMARRMFGCHRFEWCKPDQLRAIIAALVYDQKRHGRRNES